MEIVLISLTILVPVVFAGLIFWGMFELARKDRRVWGRLVGGSSITILAWLIIKFNTEDGDIDRMALAIFIAAQSGYILAGAVGWWSGRSVRG